MPPSKQINISKNIRFRLIQLTVSIKLNFLLSLQKSMFGAPEFWVTMRKKLVLVLFINIYHRFLAQPISLMQNTKFVLPM